MGKLEKLAGVLALTGALAGSVEAQEDQHSVVLAAMNNTTDQVTDCVGFVRGQRDLARENNIVMSREDQRGLLLSCQNNELGAMVAEQRRILAALDEQIRSLDLRLDDQARILDENNQVIAFIVAINGQWVIQRQLEDSIEESEAGIVAAQAESAASRARQEEMLRRAEEILQSLATS